MSDFIRVQLESGKLNITPVNSPPSGSDPNTPALSSRALSAQLRDIAGTVTIQLVSNGQLSLAARHTDGDQTLTDSISVTSASVRVNHSAIATQTDDKTGATRSTVTQQVILTLASGDSPRAATSLNIIENGKSVANFSEKSFADLWTKHPDEVRKYLIPVFDALDLQGVFSIKPDEALHVFAPLLKGLPDVKSQVEALLPKLDDDSAAVRSAAGDELDSIGPNAVPIISAMDIKTLPLQTRSTLKAFLDHMKGSHAAADNRLQNPDFLLLCLAVDDPQIPALAKKQFEKVTGKPLDFDEKAALADRQSAVEKLRLAAFAKTAP